MGNYRLMTPEGTKDYLFEEAVLRKKVEKSLRDAFQFRGYHEVITPGIEYLDVFDTPECGMPIEQMYKMVDSKGRLTVLRPDSTMPIARLCATRLRHEKLPLRLFYHQPVFAIHPSLRGRSDEVMQAGVELIGVSNQKADLEVLVTAAKALQNLRFDDFRMELGHIGLFHHLMEELGVSGEEKEQIRQLIEEKNYPALNDRMDGMKRQDIASVVKMLPRLFGGKEVFEKARTVMNGKRTLEILDYLEQLYTALSGLGLEEKLTVDFAIVNRTDYYTGIVFKGYVEGYGEEVLSGGRYDALLKEFGDDQGAVGFAVNVDSAVKALLKTQSHQLAPAEVLVHSAPGFQIQALEYIQRLAEVQVVSEYSLFDTVEQALDYAREKGIRRLDMIAEEVKTINLE